ncbi:MAG: hypothetical protein ACRCTZ_04345 [Sarcina sp.]
MKVKIVNKSDLRVVDKFKTNKGLAATIEYLKNTYEDPQIECGLGVIYCYIW